MVEVEHLEAIPGAVDEEEEVAGQEVLAEAFFEQSRETVEAVAQVHGSRAEGRADGRGERDYTASFRGARPARAATTVWRQRNSGIDRPPAACRRSYRRAVVPHRERLVAPPPHVARGAVILGRGDVYPAS
jgi:hypothetical protein